MQKIGIENTERQKIVKKGHPNFQEKKYNLCKIVEKVVKKCMWRKFGVKEQERQGVIL